MKLDHTFILFDYLFLTTKKMDLCKHHYKLGFGEVLGRREIVCFSKAKLWSLLPKQKSTAINIVFLFITNLNSIGGWIIYVFLPKCILSQNVNFFFSSMALLSSSLFCSWGLYFLCTQITIFCNYAFLVSENLVMRTEKPKREFGSTFLFLLKWIKF